MSGDFHILNIGFSNLVLVSKIVGIILADSAGGRRIKSEAKANGNLIDATQGRKTRSIIISDSGHVFLSSISPESLHKRLESKNNSIGVGEEDQSE